MTVAEAVREFDVRVAKLIAEAVQRGRDAGWPRELRAAHLEALEAEAATWRAKVVADVEAVMQSGTLH